MPALKILKCVTGKFFKVENKYGTDTNSGTYNNITCTISLFNTPSYPLLYKYIFIVKIIIATQMRYEKPVTVDSSFAPAIVCINKIEKKRIKLIRATLSAILLLYLDLITSSSVITSSLSISLRLETQEI